MDHTEQRAALVNNILKLNKRYFPRTYRARIRTLAAFDAQISGVPYEQKKTELYREYGV